MFVYSIDGVCIYSILNRQEIKLTFKTYIKTMRLNKLYWVLLMVFITSCAHSVNVSECIQQQHIYGFWGGLWHGIISPFSLISMIWSDNAVYATNNSGGWYAFGFCLGAGILGFGSSKAKK